MSKTVLGEALLNERLDRDWLQKEMSSYLGIHTSYYSQIENGRLLPSLDSTAHFVKKLKIDGTPFYAAYFQQLLVGSGLPYKIKLKAVI